MKVNVYEYPIKDKKVGDYMGSYTIEAGSPNEKPLKEKLHAKKVDSFDHRCTKIIKPIEEKEIFYLTR